jgi:hypothetical protein
MKSNCRTHVRGIPGPATRCCCRWRPRAEHRHRQRQGVPKARRRQPAAAGRARRPAGGPGDGGPGQATRSCCARSSPRKPSEGHRRQADYRAQMELARQSILIRELFEDYKPRRTRSPTPSQGRVRQVQGPVHRHRIPRPPHPGGEGRRGQGADRADQGRRQLRGTGQEAPRTPAPAPTAATSTSPSPTPTCPSSARRMTKLKKGEMTETPVKTQFGWHIIKLEDTREARVPGLRRRQGADRAAHGTGQAAAVPGAAAQVGEDRLQVQSMTITPVAPSALPL